MSTRKRQHQALGGTGFRKTNSGFSTEDDYPDGTIVNTAVIFPKKQASQVLAIPQQDCPWLTQLKAENACSNVIRKLPGKRAQSQFSTGARNTGPKVRSSEYAGWERGTPTKVIGTGSMAIIKLHRRTKQCLRQDSSPAEDRFMDRLSPLWQFTSFYNYSPGGSFLPIEILFMVCAIRTNSLNCQSS